MTKPLEPQSTALDQEGVLKDALENNFSDKSDDISVDDFSNAAIIRGLAQEIAQEKDPKKIRKLKETLTTNIIEGFVYHWTAVFFINDESTNRETHISNTKKYVREKVKAKNLALDDDESERLINEGLAAVERDAQVTNATAAVGHAADAALAAQEDNGLEMVRSELAKNPGLNELWLNDLNELSPQTAAEIAKAPNLRILRLGSLTELSPQAAVELVKTPNLSSLSISGLTELSPQAAAELAKATNLKSLWICSHAKLSPQALAELAKVPNLSMLELTNLGFNRLTELSPQAAAELTKAPNLRTLSLGSLTELSPQTAAELAKVPNLRTLELSNLTKLSPQAATELAKTPNLSMLKLGTRTELSPQAAAELTKAPNLRTLSLSTRTDLSNDVKTALSKSKNKITIYLNGDTIFIEPANESLPSPEASPPAPDWSDPIAEPEPNDDAERVRRALHFNLDALPPEDESGPVANKESDPLALPARLEGIPRGPQASVQTSRVNVPRRRVSRPTTITPFPEPVEAPALPETPPEPIQRATLSTPPPPFLPPEPEASPENALVNEAKIFFRENPNIGIMSYYRSILTPAAAAEFAKAVELRELTLDNVTNISPETARELVKAPKLEKLILEKITSLSPELEAALTPTDREITIILADGKKVTLKPKENPGFFSKGGRGERMAIGSASFVGKHAPKLWEVPISGLGKAGKGIASLGKKMPKPGKKTVLGLSAAAALTVGGIYREAIKEGVSYLVSCVTSSSEATDTTAPSPASAPATPSKEAAEFTPPETVTAKFPRARVMNGGIFVGNLKFGDYESAGGFLTRARKLIVMADTKSDNTYYYVSDEPIDIHTDTGKEFSFTYVGDEYSKVVQNYSTPLSEDELAALRAKRPAPNPEDVEELCHVEVCVTEPKELACRPSVKAKGESFARKCNDGRVITYRTDVINPDTNTPGPGIIYYSK